MSASEHKHRLVISYFFAHFFAQCQDANMAPATGARGSMANEQSRGERL
jgi:hypothetical protein